MVQKYEHKRWYVAPTEAMKEEAKRANEAALNSKPQVKPLRSLLGENAPKLVVGQQVRREGEKWGGLGEMKWKGEKWGGEKWGGIWRIQMER